MQSHVSQTPQLHGRKLVAVNQNQEFLVQSPPFQETFVLNLANQSALSHAMASPQPSSNKHRSQYVVPESAKASHPRRNLIEGG